jgi:hypothetical protein
MLWSLLLNEGYPAGNYGCLTLEDMKIQPTAALRQCSGATFKYENSRGPMPWHTT